MAAFCQEVYPLLGFWIMPIRLSLKPKKLTAF
jgi:hypothetical protein